MNKSKKLGKLIIFIDRVINLYLYFIVCACILSLVPNINPNYPLFHYIFKCAGFYLIPPVFGFSFSPMVLMITIVLVSIGLHKLYDKYFNNEPPVYIMSAEEFFEKMKKQEVANFDGSGDNTADKEENSDKENNQ